MKYRLRVNSIWEYGNRKNEQGLPHQEDCTFPLPSELKDSDRTFILCDGMGGHDAGEVASATVCQAMGNYILNNEHDADGIFTDEDLEKAIAAAFTELDKKDSGALKKMGTTMTFLKFHNNGVTVAHMGDSRVFHIRPGQNNKTTKILFETEDHSLVNDLIRIGELTREEARRSKQKNVITRAMQPHMDYLPKADIHHIDDIKAGDYFYMCSDGMLEQPEMENGELLRNIFSEMTPADEKVRILKMVTEHNSDNHTALIIKVEELIEDNHEEETSSGGQKTDEIIIGKGEERISAKKNKKKSFYQRQLTPPVTTKGNYFRRYLRVLLLIVVVLGIILGYLIWSKEKQISQSNQRINTEQNSQIEESPVKAMEVANSEAAKKLQSKRKSTTQDKNE